MMEEQKTLIVEPGDLRERVVAMKRDGYRLVQICCTRLSDLFEMNYSFDKNYEFVNFRVSLPLENGGLASVSSVYWEAFLYENEVHDLFGIVIHDMVLDYKGNFYRTAQKAPFSVIPKN